jgi:hypothetical protein
MSLSRSTAIKLHSPLEGEATCKGNEPKSLSAERKVWNGGVAEEGGKCGMAGPVGSVVLGEQQQAQALGQRSHPKRHSSWLHVQSHTQENT